MVNTWRRGEGRSLRARAGWSGLASVVFAVAVAACGSVGVRGDLAGEADNSGSDDVNRGATPTATLSSNGVQDGPQDTVPPAGANASATCPAGTYDHDGDPATACQPWTGCKPGERVGTVGSATTDRTCLACPSGSFSAGSNATACSAWTDCAAGTHVTSAPSASADRTCAPCASETYAPEQNLSVCLPSGACPAGTLQTSAGTATSAPVCEACAAGTFCAGGAAATVTCSAEEWDDDANPATACVAKSACSAGEHVVSDGSPTTNRVCELCPEGTFIAGTTCVPWTTCAGPHQFVSVPGSAAADRTCGDCAPLTYSAKDNALSCAAVKAAVAFTSAGGVDEDANDNVGIHFTVGPTPVTIYALGIYDENQDGLAESHPVGIFNATTSALVVSATIPAGAAATLDGGFRYVDVPPTMLEANTEYVIASYRASGADRVAYSVADETFASEITFQEGAFVNDAGGLALPTEGVDWTSIYGPNFKFF